MTVMFVERSCSRNESVKLFTNAYIPNNISRLNQNYRRKGADLARAVDRNTRDRDIRQPRRDVHDRGMRLRLQMRDKQRA